ncbi:hypothetical protein EE612_029357, partial [Oryza sativa]
SSPASESRARGKISNGDRGSQFHVRWPPLPQPPLETFTIILAGTQLLCAGSLHAGAHAAIIQNPMVSRV